MSRCACEHGASQTSRKPMRKRRVSSRSHQFSNAFAHCGAENIRPIAAAVAGGLACSEALLQMYQNPDDTAAIANAKEDFKSIVFTQFGSNIPFMNGTEPWPKVVADAIVFQRRNDGSGNPDSANSFLVSLTNMSEVDD
jgi:hypothetical protein